MFNATYATQKSTGKGGNARPDFGPVPQGQHVGRIVRVISFGVQDVSNQFNPSAEPVPVIQVTVELPNERIEVTDKDGNTTERPRWIWSKDIPVKFFKDYDTKVVRCHEKSKLNELLTAAFPNITEWTPQLVNEHLPQLLGAPISLFVTHSKSKSNGKVYDNIKQFIPVMRGMTVGELENDTLLYNPYDHNEEAWAKLSQYAQERINKRLDNTQAASSDAPSATPQPQQKKPAEKQPEPSAQYDDDVPF